MKKGTRSKKTKRGGGALVGFFNFGMPKDFRKSEAVERMTRAEQLANLRKVQESRPLKPPPRDFGPRRTRAGEHEAARYNAKQVPPEIDFTGQWITGPVRRLNDE
jgi:hypothetical protein